MKTNIDRPGTWAIVLGALALAGCKAAEDVRTEPYIPLPSERVVLKGVINGLGGGRAITLQYNDTAAATSFIGADPAAPTTTLDQVPFTFGSLNVGTSYNVVVLDQPFGKRCTPAGGNTGTLALGQETLVVINCVNDIPRYDLTVAIPPTPAVFSGLSHPKIVLYTGEQMQAKEITSGQTSVTFPGALFNATGQSVALTYTVSASFIDAEGNESRCLVTNSTASNPTANVTNVSVGLSPTTTTRACQFTMSGSVAYSTPIGGTAPTGAIPGGLLLEVRDTQSNVKTSHEVTSYGNFTMGGTTNPTLFTSNVNSVWDVAVARQPTGMTCVVGDGGAVSLYRSGINNPTNITEIAATGSAAGTRAWGSRLNVFCRALPASGRALAGTYRLSSSTWKAAATTAVPNPAPVTIPYNAYDWTRQNLGSSNMLTFFSDGTFLYGTHAYISGTLPDFIAAQLYSVQVEHGFYDYDPSGSGTIRFTLITDTNPTAVHPPTFGAIDNVVWNAARTGTHGLSGAPAPVVTATPTAGAGIGIWNAVMTNVQKSSVTFGQGRNPTQVLKRITGTFGGAVAADARLDWVLTEPQSITGEMTGTWVSRDNRRFWAWDYLTYYGTHVGVANGAPAMNDACFTMAQVEAPFGVYTRRGVSTGCYPYNRPPRDGGYLAGFSESADFHLTDVTVSTNTFTGVASLNTATGANVASSRLVPQFGTTALTVLPGFVGRIPGGQSAADGRSPSPVVYKIAPAATFASSVATTFYDDISQPASVYFDDLTTAGPFPSWCTTEILGIRATRNGVPINKPVYFCRSRAP